MDGAAPLQLHPSGRLGTPTLAGLSGWIPWIPQKACQIPYSCPSNPPCRLTLERLGQLDSRLSVLDNDFDEAALEAEAAGDGVEAAQQLTDSMDLIGGGVEAAARARERDEERGREKWRERDRKDRKRERSTSPRR